MRRPGSRLCSQPNRRTLRDQLGQTVAEYAVLIAASAVLLVLAILFVGWKIGGVVGDAGDKSSSPGTLTPPAATCDPNYSGACIPPYPPDLDCSDLASLGIDQVTIVGSDPHGLDPDGDGIGCN
jgi:Flp pilus assembly pilin Flp